MTFSAYAKHYAFYMSEWVRLNIFKIFYDLAMLSEHFHPLCIKHTRHISDRHSCADPKVLSEENRLISDNVFSFFFKLRGKRIQIPLKASHHIVPPAKRHLNGVSLIGRCWPNIEWCCAAWYTDFDQYCQETL